MGTSRKTQSRLHRAMLYAAARGAAYAAGGALVSALAYWAQH